jgi:nucleoside-diphosphate-sugar epimerase
VRFFIGDVRDRERLYRALDGVDHVVHAAATRSSRPPSTTPSSASRPTSWAR